MQTMSFWELAREWSVMSTWMMTPLALILAARTRKSFGFLVASVISFVSLWVFLSLPIALIFTGLQRFDFKYVAVALLASAGAYQYSRRHEGAVLDCMNAADDNLLYGARTGWSCFVACGPLMVAVFALMPASVLIMGLVAVVMIAEFVASNRAVIARSVGLAVAVCAIGILFMAGPIPFEGTLQITHMH